MKNKICGIEFKIKLRIELIIESWLCISYKSHVENLN